MQEILPFDSFSFGDKITSSRWFLLSNEMIVTYHNLEPFIYIWDLINNKPFRTIKNTYDEYLENNYIDNMFETLNGELGYIININDKRYDTEEKKLKIIDYKHSKVVFNKVFSYRIMGQFSNGEYIAMLKGNIIIYDQNLDKIKYEKQSEIDDYSHDFKIINDKLIILWGFYSDLKHLQIFDKELNEEIHIRCYKFASIKNDIMLLNKEKQNYYITFMYSDKRIDIPYLGSEYQSILAFLQMKDGRILIKTMSRKLFVIDEGKKTYRLKSLSDDYPNNPIQLKDGNIADLTKDKIEFWKVPPNRTPFTSENFMRLHQL